MDENRNPLTTFINSVLFSLQAYSNSMSFGQFSKKVIDFKVVGKKIIFYHLEKTIATRV